MARHRSIINLGVELGYFEDEKGVCNGVTLAWVEACFSGEEDVFNERVELIGSYDNTASFRQQINTIKEKAKQHERLSTQDMELLDVLAFFEKISLYQNSIGYKQLFDDTLGQHDQDKISTVVASDKVQAQGGITTLSSKASIYSVEELKQHFLAISSVITKASPSSNDEVSVLIRTSTHAMAVVYKTVPTDKGISGYWNFMDINCDDNFIIPVENIDAFINYIHGRYFAEADEYMALTTDIVTLENNPNKEQYAAAVNSMEVSSSITSEKLKSGAGKELVQLALIAGDLGALNQLDYNDVNKKLKTDIDYIHPRALIYLLEKGYDTDDILRQATKLGFPRVIDACAKHGVNLDIPFKRYHLPPPLFMAAKYGAVDVIDAFYKNGANIEQTSLEGDTLAHYSVAAGREQVIAWLATHKPDLLTQKNNQGVSPAILAAQKGSESVLRELLKLNVITKDELPELLFVAAKEGHEHLIPLFVSQNVDLGYLSSHRVSAAHLAAGAGRVEFLAALGRHGVDLSVENANGITPLMMAKYPYPYEKKPETIEAIERIIKNQPHQNVAADNAEESNIQKTQNLKGQLSDIKSEEEMNVPKPKGP